MVRAIVECDVAVIRHTFEEKLNLGVVKNIERMGGMTNHTYKVTTSESEYIIRIPGEGTEDIINRKDEKISTELVCNLGIDSRLIYFDDNGMKVCEYIPNAKTMSAELLRQEDKIRAVADVLSRLHKCGGDTRVPFDIFDMAENYESVIFANKVNLYEDYTEIKNKVFAIRDMMSEYGMKLVPCHNDPLCENWVEGQDGMYLIDWEYAGMNDGMWDLADVSIEAAYEEEHDNILLEAYLKRKPEITDKKRFFANKIYLDFLWTLWGKTRVPFDGESMEEYALERYVRLKENLLAFQSYC